MRQYTINIVPEASLDPAVRIAQYDKNYPIYFTILNGEEEADLSGVEAFFSLSKPDDTKVTAECIIADGKVIVYVTPQMSVAAGTGTATITLLRGTRRESTSSFDFVIDAAAIQDDIVSTSEYAYYEALLDRMQTAAETADNAKTAAVNAKTAAAQSATNAAASAAQAREIAVGDILAFFPIGTILQSVSSINPSLYLGGTWAPLEGKFLLAADTDHEAGTTGGEEDTTLTLYNLPDHTHGLDYDRIGVEDASSQSYGFEYKTVRRSTPQTISTEGVSRNGPIGQPFTNMPPYLAVYMWQRTA